jgi:hypothetical protein
VKKEVIATNTNETYRIIMEQFEILYSNKLENQEDKFLNSYGLPKLSQEEIYNQDRSVISNDIKTITKSLPTKKSLGLDGFTAKFNHTFKEELIPISSNYLIKQKGKLILQSQYYHDNKIQ